MFSRFILMGATFNVWCALGSGIVSLMLTYFRCVVRVLSSICTLQLLFVVINRTPLFRWYWTSFPHVVLITSSCFITVIQMLSLICWIILSWYVAVAYVQLCGSWCSMSWAIRSFECSSVCYSRCLHRASSSVM